MLATVTTKIKMCLDTYLFLVGLLQIVAISFLLQQCPQMVTLLQIVKSDMVFIFGWCCALFFLCRTHSYYFHWLPHGQHISPFPLAPFRPFLLALSFSKHYRFHVYKLTLNCLEQKVLLGYIPSLILSQLVCQSVISFSSLSSLHSNLGMTEHKTKQMSCQVFHSSYRVLTLSLYLQITNSPYSDSPVQSAALHWLLVQ